jgi:IclR family transcriptional regulator, KDG regulon repressor
MPEQSTAVAEALSSVTNAVRVLKSFSTRQRSYGVSELARTLDLSTSTTHRLLRTLAAEHVVEQDPQTGRYRLGLAVFDLIAAATQSDSLSEAVLPPMITLRDRTGETTQLAVLDGREVVYVERLQSTHTLRMFIDVGRRNSAHRSGAGKVLLAHLRPHVLAHTLDGWQLAGTTPRTITDPTVLRKELAQIREQGWGRNGDEYEVGVTSIAAPVRGANGEVVAALSLAGPTARMTADLQSITHAVMEAAAVASRRLGHRARVG